MNWRLISEPLGGVVAGGIQKKEIPIAIPLVMAAASLASSMWGAKKSRDAAKSAEAKMQAQKTETENERRLRKNQSWTDTASGQNTMRVLQQQGDRAVQQMRGAAAVGGTTEAAVAREKELQNEKQAEVIAAANANFEDKKDAVDASYRQQLSQLNQQLISVEQQKAQATAQAAQGASNALAQGAAATYGGTELAQAGAGSPGGGGVTSTPNNWQSYATRMQAESSIEAMRRNAQFFKTTQLNQMGY